MSKEKSKRDALTNGANESLTLQPHTDCFIATSRIVTTYHVKILIKLYCREWRIFLKMPSITMDYYLCKFHIPILLRRLLCELHKLQNFLFNYFKSNKIMRTKAFCDNPASLGNKLMKPCIVLRDANRTGKSKQHWTAGKNEVWDEENELCKRKFQKILKVFLPTWNRKAMFWRNG